MNRTTIFFALLAAMFAGALAVTWRAFESGPSDDEKGTGARPQEEELRSENADSDGSHSGSEETAETE